jgi:hypothetical protein
VPLSETGEFVMVTGRFEAGDGRGETLLPEGPFQAHCLGEVASWDPVAREAVLRYPVAVFR